MPNSQLAPTNRTLFSCRQCRSVNIYGSLCTWCGNQCDTIPAQEARRRRASAPHLLNDLQKEQLRLIERKLGAPSLNMLFGSIAVGETNAVRRRRNRNAAVYSMGDDTGLVQTVKSPIDPK